MRLLRVIVRWLPGPFDAFVLAGAAVNVAVVMTLFVYWLTH